MERIKALMARKVFGIPVLYLVAVAVAVLGYFAWKMKPATDKPEEETPSSDGSEGEQPLSGQPVFTSNPAPTYVQPSGDVSTEPSVDTNDKWLRRSIEWVAANKGVGVDEAQVALQAYLNGDQLSVRQGQIRDFAIAHFGLPPELVTSGGTVDAPVPVPIPDEPPPTPTPTPNAQPPTYYTTKSGDTWTSVCRKFYGNGDNAHVDYLQSWNVRSGAPHSGAMRAGIRLFVPNYQPPKYIKATATMRTAADIIKRNPPLNSAAMLSELNDGMKFPVKVGTKVRVA